MAIEKAGLRAVLENVNGYVASAKRIEGANNSMFASMGRAAGAANSFISTLVRFGSVAAIAGGAVGALAAISASRFEDTLAQVDALTNTTTEDTERLGKAILEMSKRLPKSPDELGAAAYFVLSSGINDVDQALRIVEQSAKASAAGLGETKDIVNAATSVINAYGAENISAARAIDTLVAIVREGKGEPAEFAQALGLVIPVAATAGATFEEVGAFLAIATNTGSSASEAVTQLRGVLSQLLAPSALAQKELAKFGLSADQVRKSIKEKGLLTTLFDLSDIMEGNIEAFDKILPDVRGLIGFLSVIESQGDQTRQALERISAAAGITDQAFERMSRTTSFQVQLLKNRLNVALIELGFRILPLVNQAIAFAAENFDKVIGRVTELARLLKTGLTGGVIGGNFSDFEETIFRIGQRLKDIKDFTFNFVAPVVEFGAAQNLAALRDVAKWFVDNTAALAAVGAIGFGWLAVTHPVGAILFGAAVTLTVFQLLRQDIESLSEPLLQLRRKIDEFFIHLIENAQTVSLLGLNKLFERAGVDITSDESALGAALKGLRRDRDRVLDELERDQAKAKIRVELEIEAEKSGLSLQDFVTQQLQAIAVLGTGADTTVFDLSNLVEAYDDLLGRNGQALRDFPQLTQRFQELGRTADTSSQDIVELGQRTGESVDEIVTTSRTAQDEIRNIGRAAQQTTPQVQDFGTRGTSAVDQIEEQARLTALGFPPIGTAAQNAANQVVSAMARAIASVRELAGVLAATGGFTLNPENPDEFLGMQHGGIVRSPTFAMLGEHRRPEAVLPLTDPARARQILAATPATFRAALGGGGATFAPQFIIQGATLEQQERQAVRVIRQYFAQERRHTERQGVPLSSGIK